MRSEDHPPPDQTGKICNGAGVTGALLAHGFLPEPATVALVLVEWVARRLLVGNNGFVQRRVPMPFSMRSTFSLLAASCERGESSCVISGL